MEATLVVFRRWRDTGSIIALFPEIPSDISGYFCEAYEHLGQHGGADFHGVVHATRPATDEEASSLAQELTRIGYRLKPIKRASQMMHERRRATAGAIRGAAVKRSVPSTKEETHRRPGRRRWRHKNSSTGRT